MFFLSNQLKEDIFHIFFIPNFIFNFIPQKLLFYLGGFPLIQKSHSLLMSLSAYPYCWPLMIGSAREGFPQKIRTGTVGSLASSLTTLKTSSAALSQPSNCLYLLVTILILSERRDPYVHSQSLSSVDDGNANK